MISNMTYTIFLLTNLQLYYVFPLHLTCFFNTYLVSFYFSGIDRQVLAGMADEALLKGNGGTLVKTFHEPNNGFGHTSRLTEPGLELHFQNLNFQIKDKQILHDVSGTAHPGKVLAVMGPSGKYCICMIWVCQKLKNILLQSIKI